MKILGYTLSIIGLIGLLLTFEQVKSALKIPLPEGLTNNILTIISIVIVLVGVFIIIKSGSSRKVTEVPIYHGKKVVGFRRLGKK